MSTAITRVELRYEQDVVYARSRARIIAEQLGFDKNDQTRISTAVSEIARNAYKYAGGGEIEFVIDTSTEPNVYAINVLDHGKGIPYLDEILEGRVVSQTGMGLGIIGSKRLMDHFHIDTLPGKGTTVFLGKNLPVTAPPVTPVLITHITDVLVKTAAQSPFEEIQIQNQDIIRALEELRQRQEELIKVNRELEDTNRGVVALYAELDDKAVSLIRANDQLKEFDRLKSLFIASMSHELRTPLNSIIGFTGILLMGMSGDLNDEQAKQLGMVQKSGRHLLELINDVIDISKIEADKIEPEITHFDLGTVLEEIRKVFQPQADKQGLLFTVDAPGTFWVTSDERRVKQVITNMVSNAVKFTDSGAVTVSVKKKNTGIAVSVRDTGIGISDAEREHLFTAFGRIATPGRTADGTGLGLYLSRKLALILSGTIDMESVPGSGSTFTFTLPPDAAKGGAS